MRQLLLGAGNSRKKKMVHPLTPDKEFTDLVTLDITGDADILHNLDNLPYDFFRDGYFDEIHAYEVLSIVVLRVMRSSFLTSLMSSIGY